MPDRLRMGWRTAERPLLLIAMPCLLVGTSAFLLSHGMYDTPRTCLRQVLTFVHDVERAMSPDPGVQNFVFERIGAAHDLCQRGAAQEAEHILVTLKAGLGG